MERAAIISAKAVLLVLIAFLSLSLTGCYDAKEPDDFGYVMAIGVDKGKINFLKMTVQIAVPTKIGGSSSSGEGGGGMATESSLMESVETPSIWSGLNMLNSFTSRQLNFSHAKALVFSEELAREGLDKYLHALIRNREFRPNMRILVSRTSAEDYIKNVKPELETNPAKYYELNFKAGSYTGLTPVSSLSNFYHDTEALDTQAVAILASTNKFSPDKEPDLTGSTYTAKGRPFPFEGDFKAGDIPRKAQISSEIMGTAVFNGTKMVGELDGEETGVYLMATGEYNYAFWTFQDPKHPDKVIVLNIRQNRIPSIDVKISSGIPLINLNLNLEADILSIQSNESYEMPSQISLLENAVENTIRKEMQATFEKCARQYHSDIFGFGRKVKTLFLTWKQWEDFKWLDTFPKAQLNTNVKLEIRRTGLIIRAVPLVNME